MQYAKILLIVFLTVSGVYAAEQSVQTIATFLEKLALVTPTDKSDEIQAAAEKALAYAQSVASDEHFTYPATTDKYWLYQMPGDELVGFTKQLVKILIGEIRKKKMQLIAQGNKPTAIVKNPLTVPYILADVIDAKREQFNPTPKGLFINWQTAQDQLNQLKPRVFNPGNLANIDNGTYANKFRYTLAFLMLPFIGKFSEVVLNLSSQSLTEQELHDALALLYAIEGATYTLHGTKLDAINDLSSQLNQDDYNYLVNEIFQAFFDVNTAISSTNPDKPLVLPLNEVFNPKNIAQLSLEINAMLMVPNVNREQRRLRKL